MTERLNKRELAKAATRQRVIDGAKALWKEPGTYLERTAGGNGIRDIAIHIGMSTGAIFANFDSKDDLWRAAFECEPPIDSVLTRAAPRLFQALQDLIEVRPEIAESEDPHAALAWRRAEGMLERIKAQLLDEEAAPAAEADPSAGATAMAA